MELTYRNLLLIYEHLSRSIFIHKFQVHIFDAIINTWLKFFTENLEVNDALNRNSIGKQFFFLHWCGLDCKFFPHPDSNLYLILGLCKIFSSSTLRSPTSSLLRIGKRSSNSVQKSFLGTSMVTSKKSCNIIIVFFPVFFQYPHFQYSKKTKK